ncbi:putative peptidase, degenerate [Anaplasma phagocytophilum str. HZ]|uniref:Peptidase domain protein n=2 Tax=Anaplasma phagocytophilum TaxID=948 RepID=Q2GJ08_ANAPZ|nr:peptidase domain protein [Anaplasma phagocytophilum str. HZ]AEB26877.1 putative peptidase, degenerate [Anaplasma phagocytophilum str. HZ]
MRIIMLQGADENQKLYFLVLSDGHCQLMLAHDIGNYSKLGDAIDDSLDEAFDKECLGQGIRVVWIPMLRYFELRQ